MNPYGPLRKRKTFPATNPTTTTTSRETTGWNPYPGGDVNPLDRVSSSPFLGAEYSVESTHPYQEGTRIHEDYTAYKEESRKFAAASAARNTTVQSLAARRRNRDEKYYKVADTILTPSGHRTVAPYAAKASVAAQRASESRQQFTTDHIGRAYKDKKDYQGHRRQIIELDNSTVNLADHYTSHLECSRKPRYNN